MYVPNPSILKYRVWQGSIKINNIQSKNLGNNKTK